MTSWIKWGNNIQDLSFEIVDVLDFERIITHAHFLVMDWVIIRCFFLLQLVGLGLLVVGVIYQVNFTKLTDVIPSELSAVENVPIFAIVVGSIILVISFLGCCGAFKNNTCMLSWVRYLLFTWESSTKLFT